MTTDRFANESEIAKESREGIQAAYQLPVEWVKSFLAIDEALSKGNHQEALALLRAATLPEDVSSILKRAIETGDDHAIEQVFREYKGRIGQAFCESCWR
ncbi:MAG: hypothetical protein FJ012_11015 [Chloroflexi bacterium]|nr:hypothetical protein [Chloroflexota bacterium]